MYLPTLYTSPYPFFDLSAAFKRTHFMSLKIHLTRYSINHITLPLHPVS